MTRSKFSTKVALLVAGIGLCIATFTGPASAQSVCPGGYYYDPYYGCTVGVDTWGWYGYPYGYGSEARRAAAQKASADGKSLDAYTTNRPVFNGDVHA